LTKRCANIMLLFAPLPRFGLGLGEDLRTLFMILGGIDFIGLITAQ